MTTDQFFKLEYEYGIDFAISQLADEEDYIAGQETTTEVLAEDIGDWVIMGDFDKAIKYIKMLQDYDGTLFWYYNYKDRNGLKPLQYAEDVQFLLTED